jgi:hypothetical protein
MVVFVGISLWQRLVSGSEENFGYLSFFFSFGLFGD